MFLVHRADVETFWSAKLPGCFHVGLGVVSQPDVETFLPRRRGNISAFPTFARQVRRGNICVRPTWKHFYRLDVETFLQNPPTRPTWKHFHQADVETFLANGSDVETFVQKCFHVGPVLFASPPPSEPFHVDNRNNATVVTSVLFKIQIWGKVPTSSICRYVGTFRTEIQKSTDVSGIETRRYFFPQNAKSTDVSAPQKSTDVCLVAPEKYRRHPPRLNFLAVARKFRRGG